ncbi:thermonuclease family protein [Qipengyuania sp. XHP0207]|uniref:thermonuclease family protein n=1 Tax=Qipengyuania sp. XHP0207 TaxID=3038078 RepID=UPI00241DFA77|nr:thermonuclease family protein [Qipengyuania sp. XHP0207]MDG5747812.1 thermonuclease family protein [Qipengyuania sp. XHP0207]
MPRLVLLLALTCLSMTASMPSAAQPRDTIAAQFPLCASSPRVTCVVDGDTIWLDGTKIRIADIDTPEVSRPRCPREARLGELATLRMQALLNRGAFALRAAPSGHDEDRFGRKLRVVSRDGESLGVMLVRDGLARPWGGKRRSWCEAV